MSKNPEAIRLFENILKFGDQQTASTIAHGCALPVSPTEQEKEQWVNFTTSKLVEHFPDETIQKIRMGCRCSLEWDIIEQAKKIYQSSKDIKEFILTSNQILGTNWQETDGSILVTYSQCPCPMVNGFSSPVHIAWCYCTLGYNRDFFEYVLSTKVEVSLKKAIKLGDETCQILVTSQPL